MVEKRCILVEGHVVEGHVFVPGDPPDAPYPHDRCSATQVERTVGDEFKAAVQHALIEVAKEALKMHTTFEDRKITNVDDVQAFRGDMTRLEGIVRDIDIDGMRAARYYRALESDRVLD